MAIASSRGVLTSLLQTLDRSGPLVILPHDNPDPDALASAVALKHIVTTLLEKEARTQRIDQNGLKRCPLSLIGL